MSTGHNYEDPLERLAAEENWQDRAKAVEAEVVRRRRRDVLRMPRISRMKGRGISLIFVALVAVTLVSAVTLWREIGPTQASVFVLVLAGWLVTLCLHEFGHALTAHRGGDDSVVDKGYLRLDPRKYGHPVLTLLLPLLFLISGGIALPGGAVYLNKHLLRSRLRASLVSAAGPAINIVAAAILFVIVSVAGPDGIYSLSEPHAAFWAGLTFLAYLQVAVAILNLVPMPGLDGYGIIEPYLAETTQRKADKIKPFGLLLVFVLLALPPIRTVFGDAVDGVLDLGGAPVNGTFFGYHLFQFWR